MGHAIGEVITDAATIDVAVGVLVGVMVEAGARLVVDVVYTACITLFTSIMVLDDLVPVHTVRDIDPDEPTNIFRFRAVE